ncbi:16S rRNA (adenine(1518)-N(6)/adenine(1519)-N(6))-dimethyltransferase RsmA [Microvirga sp. STS02]|uniref:16S rRNA (adenine(1518)-N(6)/adenine(1519)-N(6))- dimethyltransferase RsmA n=1 Tax=Hymenobacter negativus TaxID=2795026 RepID=UPI0018DBB96E|nr:MULTISPECIES: 16S rRNA (adenine(1518)-N(6)/adenine(1519)-N(6))-dimethyltransferase RsmA [Bacteria]MBH8569085.1 16S rRNA (adenine(1518)-N(6)/adenine(1519)-N(6))-dimethyltransferase RsmA [Hymenobacter negativus]MBR7208820.1 16S rRNA (adenine(1518)-N(6)/adenine(1519)-N(6))-dimethyltransferase RsmA [Microvirga sp. STS02]
MNTVRPKKHLGQHFLADPNIARNIVGALQLPNGVKEVLEIGPGMGVLTQYLLQNPAYQTSVVEIDTESVAYLKVHYPALADRIYATDFLKQSLATLFPGQPLAIIGNFPYNISSQIFFAVLNNRQQVREVVGMIQKEVAERLAEPPGSKTYGILSVLLQAFYKIEYLFTVPPHVFNPPPKVESAVVRLTRNDVQQLDCDEKLFFRVVKQAFQTRRKTLRNALKPFGMPAEATTDAIFERRAETLSVADFVALTRHVAQHQAGGASLPDLNPNDITA